MVMEELRIRAKANDPLVSPEADTLFKALEISSDSVRGLIKAKLVKLRLSIL